MDVNQDDVFTSLVAQKNHSLSELELEPVVNVQNVYSLKTVENYLYVFSSALTRRILIRVYLIKRDLEKITLAPKFKHTLYYKTTSDGFMLPEKFSGYQQLNKNFELPAVIFGTPNGLIFSSNPCSAAPAIIYDLKQKLIGTVSITLQSLPKTPEVLNSLVLSSQAKDAQLVGDILCFVGENGRVGIAIGSNTIEKKSLNLAVGQLSVNVVCCTSFENVIVAASKDYLYFFKVVCECKLTGKDSKDMQRRRKSSHINVQFTLLKQLKICNVSEMFIHPVSRTALICHTSSQSIMVVNVFEVWTTNNTGDYQRNVTCLLKVYDEQNKENEVLKNQSLELNRTLVHLSIVGEWIKLINDGSKSCLGIDRNITIVRSNSKKFGLLTLSFQNKSQIILPAFCSITIRYQPKFQRQLIQTETMKLNAIPASTEQTFSIQLCDRFVCFSPLEFNVSITFSLQTYPSIYLPVETFTLSLIELCEITSSILTIPNQLLTYPKTSPKPQTRTMYDFRIQLNPSKFNSKDSVFKIIATCLNIRNKDYTGNTIMRYSIEYMHDEVADMEIKLDSMLISVSTTNIMFLASLHYYLFDCLKEYITISTKCEEEDKRNVVEMLKELSSVFTKNATGQDSGDVVATLSKFYSLQRQ